MLPAIKSSRHEKKWRLPQRKTRVLYIKVRNLPTDQPDIRVFMLTNLQGEESAHFVETGKRVGAEAGKGAADVRKAFLL